MLSHVIKVKNVHSEKVKTLLEEGDWGYYHSELMFAPNLKSAEKFTKEEGTKLFNILRTQRGYFPKLMTVKEAIMELYAQQQKV